MLNKKEGPSEDASISLRKGNKIIMGGRGREGLGGRGEGEGGQNQLWGRQKRSPKGWETLEICRDLEYKRISGLNVGD